MREISFFILILLFSNSCFAQKEFNLIKSLDNDIVLDGTDGSATNAGDKIILETMRMDLEGADLATDIMGTQAYRTGFGVDTFVGRVNMLEGSDDKLINETDGVDGFAAETYTTDADGLVLETKAGSSSGSTTILKGVTTS